MTKDGVVGKWLLVFAVIYTQSLFTRAQQFPGPPKCLIGYMTDVQNWVDENGGLRSIELESSIDVSTNSNPVRTLHTIMRTSFKSPLWSVKYLSMARCDLTRVPPVFNLTDSQGRRLAATLEYMSFYGNSFSSLSQSGDQYDNRLNATGAKETTVYRHNPQLSTTLWSAGFQDVNFQRLKELDIRACFIKVLNAHLFRGMSNLEALYLGENEIYSIEANAFGGLPKLAHLDLSRNQGFDDKGSPLNLQADSVFQVLTELVSLDLSFTKLTQRNLAMFRGLSKNLRSLSICNTGLKNLLEGIFSDTCLQILDVSGNNGILSTKGALQGLENSLKILYSKETGLQSFDIFRNFTKLEILQLASNEIGIVRGQSLKTMRNLKILDLRKNRLISWFEPTYAMALKLKLLDLGDNNINVIMETMVQDIANISYLALSGNFIVCNCHAKDFLRMASLNEFDQNLTLIETSKGVGYHSGYEYYNALLIHRKRVDFQCDNPYSCGSIENTGRFRLLDYAPGVYSCLLVSESKSVKFGDVDGCSKIPREIDYDEELAGGRRKLLALVAIPCLVLPLGFLFMFRRNLKYCIITIRNSAMIGMINKNDIVNDGTIFNYDVFVSYCNEDRGWVLDHLLPHLEAECSISACLHERDFQVGLSILENIVSCMDRSRSIMLIISQQFLRSQWCQFEMHLAQHRLLETRREDLTLVLLEDIPRRLRPNTLHYLMLTKTYIVWPKDEAGRPLFWKRLQKALLTHKIKYTDNVSVV